jgi:hypothetical protein
MPMTDEQHESLYADIRALLAEHFPNFMFIVMDDDGDLYYDYNNVRIGRMLLKEAASEMQAEVEDLEVVWFEEDDEDE